MKSAPDPSTDSQHEACEASFVCRGALDEIVLKGAQRMLAEAVESEVEQYMQERSGHRDERGHRQVVRNGRMPTQQLQTSAGPLEIAKPSLILADEPTGNLHTEQGGEIMDLFKKLDEAGTKIIQVTHDATWAKHGRHIVTLKDGWLE